MDFWGWYEAIYARWLSHVYIYCDSGAGARLEARWSSRIVIQGLVRGKEARWSSHITHLGLVRGKETRWSSQFAIEKGMRGLRPNHMRVIGSARICPLSR